MYSYIKFSSFRMPDIIAMILLCFCWMKSYSIFYSVL